MFIYLMIFLELKSFTSFKIIDNFESKYFCKSLGVLTMLLGFYLKKFFTKKIFLLVMLIFFSNNPLLFFVFFEISVWMLAFLLIFKSFSPERNLAFSYFIVFSFVGGIPLLFSIIFFLEKQNLMKFTSFSLLFDFDQIMVHQSFFFIETVFFFLAFLMKTPLFGSHYWLIKAHVESKTLGSMILAAILLKTGTVGIFRFSKFFPASLKIYKFFWFYFLMMLALLPCLILFRKTDGKMIIAFSSVAHMTLGLLGFLFFCQFNLMGGFYLCLGHGLISAGSFGVFGESYPNRSSRNILLNTPMKTPNLKNFLFFSLVAKASIPPFSNFFGEVFLFSFVVNFFYKYYFFISICVTYIFFSGSFCMIFYLFLVHNHKKKYKISKKYINWKKMSMLYFYLIFSMIIFFFM